MLRSCPTQPRFFLPYQLRHTAKELLASCPELPAFLAAKRRYDPGDLLPSAQGAERHLLKTAHSPLGTSPASQFADRFATPTVADAARLRSVLTTA